MNFAGNDDPQARLYVGNLHPDIDEEDLEDKFSHAGQLKSVQVGRDGNKSLGYGYIEYDRYEDAEKAIRTLNSVEIRARPILIMWVQQEPSEAKFCKIFVKNLDSTIDNNTLHAIFSKYGQVSFNKVARDSNGHSKGYGFIHFETEEETNKAIENIDGKYLKGKKLSVAKYTNPVTQLIPCESSVTTSSNGSIDDDEDEYSSANDDEGEEYDNSDDESFTNVYVKNFDKELTDAKFKTMFEPFGEITSHTIMKDENGESRGFGFVAYEEAESALDAVKFMNGIKFQNRILYVAPAQTKEEREETLKNKQQSVQHCNLYVKQLASTITDKRLFDFFSTFGDITSSTVVTENGKSKGYGYVCYRTQDSAKKALEVLNGRKIDGKKISVSYYKSKGERQAEKTKEKKKKRLPSKSRK